MTAPVPFACPFIGKEEEEAVLRVLRSGWLTTGRETLAFEEEFAAFLDGPLPGDDGPPPGEPSAARPPLRASAVNSATSGLHLALEACGVGLNDLVLVPSYTFTSSAEVIRYLGAEPVFVDVAPGTFHIDPAALELTLDRLFRGLPAYTPRRGKDREGGESPEGFGPRGRPKALIPVHYGGLPCDMAALMALSARYNLRVIEDAAHSFPSLMPGGSWAGALGDAGVFSFYATKTITTGEGGMVVSRDRTITDRIALMRSHGIDRAIWARYTDPKASWYYEVVEPGYKYNLPDLLAALGRVQLSRARSLLAMREAIARSYDEAFGAEEALSIPPTGGGDARHLYPLRLNPEKLSLSRDDFIEKLKEEGIGVSVHFIPLHIMPYYKKRYNLKGEDFPESLKSFHRVISLPIWPGMKPSQVERVISGLISLVRRYRI
jgi:dTDP-4-amino-4,6-dideoxygalactose transaminase